MKCGLRVPKRVRDCHLSVTVWGTHAKVIVMVESASSLFSLAERISIFSPSSCPFRSPPCLGFLRVCLHLFWREKITNVFFIYLFIFHDISFGEFILDLSQKSPQYQNPPIDKWLSLSPPLLQRINRRLASDTDGRGGHNRGSGSAGEKLSLLTGESEEIHYSCSPTRSSSESNW